MRVPFLTWPVVATGTAALYGYAAVTVLAEPLFGPTWFDDFSDWLYRWQELAAGLTALVAAAAAYIAAMRSISAANERSRQAIQVRARATLLKLQRDLARNRDVLRLIRSHTINRDMREKRVHEISEKMRHEVSDENIRNRIDDIGSLPLSVVGSIDVVYMYIKSCYEYYDELISDHKQETKENDMDFLVQIATVALSKVDYTMDLFDEYLKETDITLELHPRRT